MTETLATAKKGERLLSRLTDEEIANRWGEITADLDIAVYTAWDWDALAGTRPAVHAECRAIRAEVARRMRERGRFLGTIAIHTTTGGTLP